MRGILVSAVTFHLGESPEPADGGWREMAKTTNNKSRAKAGPARASVPAAKKKTAAVKVEVKDKDKDKEPAAGRKPPVSEQERRRMIAEAAYYRAEKRGFSGGSSLDDWIAAEIEVDARLARDYLR